MTEKHYGGSSSIPAPKSSADSKMQNKNSQLAKKEKQPEESSIEESLSESQIETLKKAGDIAKKAKTFAREIIKPQMSLLEIAEKIESKIIELGGKPAFPVNLSINEIAAHATPAYNDEQKASGLLKIDLGVHIGGFVADTAFSLDLENSEENKKLIQTTEECLLKGVSVFNLNNELKEVGAAIEENAKKSNLQPIINLSGHSIKEL